MSRPDQTEGRKANGAIPGGKPDAATPDKAVTSTGRLSTTKAGPDGPSAAEVGDTFKKGAPTG